MSIPDHAYLVVLAGGSGSRFWPKSRLKRPKQLCRLGGDELTMIEKTLARFDGHIPVDRRLIVTHKDQIEATKNIVSGRCVNYVAEPEAKNTANALCLAALEIERMAAGRHRPIMISVHADHLIQRVEEFIQDIEKACQVAESGYLTLLGVRPEYPETGYGYIEAGSELPAGPKLAYEVASFREKPDRTTAESYLKHGGYLWNSGLFVWRTEVLLSELEKYLPMPVQKLSALGHESFSTVRPERLAEVYASLPKIAIDNAVLELSDKVAVIETDFGWKDVGSWDALVQSFALDKDGNYLSGDVRAIDCRRATIESEGPFVAAIGLENFVVVATKDAVLVCPESRAQEVKQVVEFLKQEGRVDLI